MINEVVVCSVEELYRECSGYDVDIYGAKIEALKACIYLEDRGVNVNSFVVSKIFKNSENFLNKPVKYIEDANGPYECMVLAVTEKSVWSAEEAISKCDVNKLVIISPLMEYYSNYHAVSEVSRISSKVFFDSNVMVFADDTSSIILEDNVSIMGNCVIFASSNSNICIKRGSCIGAGTVIFADIDSSIDIDEKSMIKKNCICRAVENSSINIGKKISVGYKSKLEAIQSGKIQVNNGTIIGCEGTFLAKIRGEIRIYDDVSIGSYSQVVASTDGKVSVGRVTTFGSNLFLGAKKQDLIFGEYNMFSDYICANVGFHTVVDKLDRPYITKRDAITGNHVWVGMGATLLPGCDVGDNSIVGAAAVVTKKIEANCTCAGNPATVKRTNIDWCRW